MPAQCLTIAPRKASAAAVILVVDDMPGRRDLISKILQPEYEICACRNLREALTRSGEREFRAVFVAWNSAGPDGVSDFDGSERTTRDVVVIFETESERNEASEFFKAFFPGVTLRLLHAPSGRLSARAVLQ